VPLDRRGWPSAFGRGQPDRGALLILSHLETLPPRRLRELAWHLGTARACVRAVQRGAGGERDRALAEGVDVEVVETALAGCGARHICPKDDEYPAQLLDLPDPPASLFVRGHSLDEPKHAVSVVGARSCSAYGREVAENIGQGLAAQGVAVVSGAARGVDAAAHRGALVAAGPTIAVLGSGIDVAYPSSNRGLIEKIAHLGTVVSEYPPGIRAHSRRFPARNRLIAGLSRAVVVVEGGAGSGSLISAEFALDLGRDVFAVPGPVTSPLSVVPHELLREGAFLARGSDDILEALGLPRPAPNGVALSSLEGLSSDERRVLEGLSGEPVTAEAVAGHARLPINAALSVLMSLEVRGLIRGLAGRYQRTSAAPAIPLDREGGV
jgi:DNA processing protein